MLQKNTNLAKLQRQLGYQFKDIKLLQQAVTHRSFSSSHYERLEFLGDAVLGLVISDWLFNKFGTILEGDLSRMRASLVNQASLASIANKLDLAENMRLGEGELSSGGQQRQSILADMLEAIIAAVYLDSDFTQAQQVVLYLFAKIELSANSVKAVKDAKTTLQELMQQQKKPLPKYSITEILGAEHAQTFVVSCTIQGIKQVGIGKGSSRRNAEQQAAQDILQYIT